MLNVSKKSTLLETFLESGGPKFSIIVGFGDSAVSGPYTIPLLRDRVAVSKWGLKGERSEKPPEKF